MKEANNSRFNGVSNPIDSHPVEQLYQAITHILDPVLGQVSDFDGCCSYCLRDSSLFGGKAYLGRDSYKRPIALCQCCQSLNVGDTDIMGIERSGTVPHKFGMMSGAGCVVELNTGKSVLFAPSGMAKKFPSYFTERINVVVVGQSEQLIWIYKNMPNFPILYISSFGRKTKALIQGLRYSLSSHAVVACNDTDVYSSSASKITTNLDCLMSVIDAYTLLNSKQRTAFELAVTCAAKGFKSPLAITEILRNDPDVMDIFRRLPTDPYQRITLISTLKKAV